MAGHPAKTQVEHQYTMLAKTRVNNLDGGGWDMDEKDLQAGTRRWSIDKRGLSALSPAGDSLNVREDREENVFALFQGLGFEMWSSRSFWAFTPGLIRASFCVQS